MKLFFDAFRSLWGAVLVALALAGIGCGALDELNEVEPAADLGGWATEFRANDKEASPLGVSSRAREIERSVGIR